MEPKGDPMRLFLLGIVVLQLAGASAVEAASQPEVQEQRNSDGSWLRLTQTEQPAQGRRLLQVDLRTSANAPYAPVLQRSQVLAEFPRGRGRLEDIDGDGLWEFVETDFCGAGPNCVQTIFKVNPQRKTAWRFLHGGFFTVRRIGAFVVTAGRSSCCSWVHQAYRVPAGERTITDQDLAYSISVSGPLDKTSTTARCVISRPAGSGWVLTDLKHKQLRQLCALYGDDVVINPPYAEPTP